MKEYPSILQEPIITEKGSNLSASQNKYLFKVHPKANKLEIKEAVEKIFNVKVEAVNTLNVLGKIKRVRYRAGRTANWKKAIVTLAKDQKIDYTK
jgi:large subunit ribosomal protein L23